jgi:hypothetical protein
MCLVKIANSPNYTMSENSDSSSENSHEESGEEEEEEEPQEGRGQGSTDIANSSSDESADGYYDETENFYNSIYDQDQDFYETDKEHGKYYLGSYELLINTVSPRSHTMVCGVTISVPMFLNNNHEDVSDYIFIYSMFCMGFDTKMEIMQVFVVDSQYVVVLKTFWIRIVQRLWKKTFKKRKETTALRRRRGAISHKEIRGEYPFPIKIMPSIRGMLAGL